MNKYLLLLCLALCGCTTVFAQIKINGHVDDKDGMAMPGVTVALEGTNQGTITDLDGNYSLTVPDRNGILIFSFIGYQVQKVQVGSRTKIDVVLESTSVQMDEVVVIGYGTTRRKDLTGSVVSVKSEALQNRLITSLDDALSGSVPGLMIQSSGGQPGAASNMLIRGANSLTGSTQPLIVIDGFPLFDAATSGGGGMSDKSGGMSAFALVNPDDIASIEVLKDASATAIYGNRGANGVILITTKKGRVDGSKIQYNTSFGMQQLPRKYDMMDFLDYAKYQNLKNPNNKMFTDQKTGEMLGFDPNIRTVDWQDEIYRTGFVQNHSLSVQGATEKTNFMISGSFMQDKSIIKNTDWQKLTAKATIDHSFSKKLKVGADINFSQIKDDGVPTGGGDGTAVGTVIGALLARPFILDETTQSYLRRAGVDQSIIDSDLASYKSNPLNMVEAIDMKKTIRRTILNGYAQYNILDDLQFKTTIGYDIYSLKDSQFYPKSTPLGNLNNGLGILGHIDNQSWINENTLTWSPVFAGEHHLNILLGVSEQGWKSSYDRTELSSFEYEALGYDNAQMAKNFTAYSSSNETHYVSLMGRANYSFSGKYMATFTVRRDATSIFLNNKWGTFYSGALAYNIKEENFLKDVKAISNLKLRLSLGEVGNSNVPTTGAYAQLYNTNHSFDNSIVIGQSPASLANEDLKWEKTQEWNLGLELGLLHDRIQLTADYYIKTTKDLLLEAPVLNISGFDKAWQNIGKLRNSGLELGLNALLINRKDLQWTFQANFSMNKSKVLELGQNGAPIYLPVSFMSGNAGQQAVILREGGSIGEIYGYVTEGVYGANDFYSDGTPKKGVAVAGVGEKPGFMKYKDVKEDSAITSEDRQVIGNTMPDFYGAFGTMLSYKGFDLNIGFQYSYGNDVYNANYIQTARFDGLADYNQMDFYKNRWTLDNPTSTQYADMSFGTMSSAFVEDASFLRLKTVRLTYTFPSRWLEKTHVIRGLKVYIAGDNLYTFTKYSGYDPEIHTAQGAGSMTGVLTSGFDYGAFPLARTFSIGANFEF